MKRYFLHLGILTAFCIPLFFLNLGGWDLWNPDEPRYAEVAREMTLRGEWFIPHLNGELYYDKPPMFFWFINIASKITGKLDATSARLPSAFFGLMTVWLVYLLGKKIKDASTGLMSGLVLATSAEFFWLARRANIDVTLTFFVTLSIILFLLGMEAERKVIFFSLSYLSLAFGFLTKLYPAIIVFVLAIGPLLLFKHRTKLLLYPSHLLGLFGFLAPVGLWLYIAARSEGVDYLQGLLWQKTAFTFFESYGHDRPLYYYLYNFPIQFLPWSVFLPWALYWGFKCKERLFLPLVWFILGFVFFSLSEAKRGLYLLPLYPAASLLVGSYLTNVTLARLPFQLIGSLLLGGGICLLGLLPKAEAYFSNPLEVTLPLSVICLLGGLLILFCVKKASYRLGFYLLSLTSLGVYVFLVYQILPQINAYKSYRLFSERILKVMGKNDQLAVYKLQGAELNFYTGIVPIQRFYEGGELLKQLEKGPLVCVMRKKDLQELLEKGVKVKVIFEQRVGGKHLVVVTNKEVADEGTTP